MNHTQLPLSERIQLTAQPVIPTGFDDLTWRSLEHADLPALLVLQNLCNAVDSPESVTTLDELEESFATPSFDAKLDSLIAFDTEGRAVAHAESFMDDEAETLVNVYLNGCVHPERRREGIGRALLAWQEARGLQQLAASPLTLPGWLNTHAEADASAPLALLKGAGYLPTRWWLSMQRVLGDDLPVRSLAEGVRFEPYSAEWSEPARIAMNDAFRDHWGSQPASKDEWESGERLESFKPELSTVAVVTLDDGSEQVAGVLTVEISEEEWQANGFSFGYISGLGVLRDWRGKGIAQGLLTRALAQLKAAGLERAVLDVDSDSPTGANGLYEHLGFREKSRSLSLTKQF
ncbi:GNAT family N-acetyltransferase [Leucobacter sp. UT-8R-CII-1-4]|uniref:GNAT family N-acetyltransferase n=1 Tax=Leucobacter sp. UT-8R-CII-1-4 TaxID=3040075 RepID=UPI0024A89E57|nr:GNAT family N-acetyltransferase [Leucobacter sp. UT-8R-CII-1-4]MDI6022716.1 GNAT family N-acetyltransferase [Leucobacter sp. UT-8R-CII-1-4]